MSNKSNSFKRQVGAYETPYRTARHMVDLVIPYFKNTQNFSILDPSVGDGVFIKALLEHGVNPSNITAHDINAEVVEKVRKMGIKTLHMDSLLDDFEKKDIIIGNPPYKSQRNSVYMKENRVELEKRYKSIGLYNLYSLFMFNSIKHLNDDGILCFIVEDAFLTNRYYYRFRKFLLDSCEIIEIKLAPRKLFHASKADVRTAILTIQKRNNSNSSKKYIKTDKKHIMRLVDRLSDENDYLKAIPQKIPQFEFRKMPDLKFFIGIPRSIYEVVQHTKLRFGDIAKGGTGISTGNDKHYLQPAKDVNNDPNWVGFYKSGRRNAFFYKTPYYIEKDYKKNMRNNPKNFLVRNENYYFQEGLTCSSVGRRFSAAYMPSGNLFGVNANFFFNDSNDLFYFLGFLNSNLAKYILRKVLIRTNIVATSFIREIPIIEPNENQRNEIIGIVERIVSSLIENPNYSFTEDTKRIDEILFEVYKIPTQDIDEIMDFNENIIERA